MAAEGWSSESAELADIVEAFGLVIGGARGAHCFIAYAGDRPIAAGGLVINTDVALLAGASTIPSARQRGAQRALLEARLRFAAGEGCDLAMMVALPGGGSHRNAERQGFRVTYTRTKWHGVGRSICPGQARFHVLGDELRRRIRASTKPRLLLRPSRC